MYLLWFNLSISFLVNRRNNEYWNRNVCEVFGDLHGKVKYHADILEPETDELGTDAVHTDDDASLPPERIAAELELVEAEFGGDSAAFAWRVAYRCPQCSARIAPADGVALSDNGP